MQLATWKMMAVWAAAVVLLHTGQQITAQTAAEPTNNVKLDSPQARVLIATEQPHRPTPQHEHAMNRVLIYLGPGQMKVTNPAGAVETLTLKAGEVRWSPGVMPHI